MPKQMITDEFWPKLLAILTKLGVYAKANLRKVLEGILYHRRTSITWRDLPEEYGRWFSVYKQFLRWSKSGLLIKMFKILSAETYNEWISVDSTYVKVHQDATGYSVFSKEATGKSRGGNTSKIHLITNAYGLPIDFEITGGDVSDVKIGEKLVQRHFGAQFVIADKGYDSEKLRAMIREKNATPVIPRKKNSKRGNNDLDKIIYKYRHQVENSFTALKKFRNIATRTERLKVTFSAGVALTCSFLWKKLWS